jgi:hypothetical protein
MELRHNTPPLEIELLYQQEGASHVFTAPSIGGFYYSSTSLEATFTEAPDALSMHISRLFGAEAAYRFELSLADFKRQLVADNDPDDVSDLVLKNAVIAKMATMEFFGRH